MPMADIYGKMRPTNLLLMTQGYKAWASDVYNFTPGSREVDPRYHQGLKHQRVGSVRGLDSVRPYHEVGNPVSYSDSSIGREAISPDDVFAWLPPNFCPCCDAMDMREPGAGGTWVFIDDHPEIGARRGQAVAYFAHEQCVAKRFNPKARGGLVLPNNGWSRLQGSHHLTIEDRILTFFRSRHPDDRQKYFKVPH